MHQPYYCDSSFLVSLSIAIFVFVIYSYYMHINMYNRNFRAYIPFVLALAEGLEGPSAPYHVGIIYFKIFFYFFPQENPLTFD